VLAVFLRFAPSLFVEIGKRIGQGMFESFKATHSG
jgi:hypothetical protein